MQIMIFETLQNLCLTNIETSFIFSKSTRDVKNLNVWKDKIFLEECGFRVDYIKGIQRYGFSNNLIWLAQGKPGGHKNQLSLNTIDATDTIISVVSKIKLLRGKNV